MSAGRLIGLLIAVSIGYAVLSKPDHSIPPPIAALPPQTFTETPQNRRGESGDEALDQAKDEITGDTFEDHGDTSQCTEDCSGHEAGFQWAAEHEITDPGDCGGTSDSFIEGCQSFGQAVQERAEEIHDEQSDEDQDDEQ